MLINAAISYGIAIDPSAKFKRPVNHSACKQTKVFSSSLFYYR